jgi:alpha-2-macroglobulin
MRYFLVWLLICVNGIVFSQDLLKSRQTSYFTYVFRITDKEAKKIYKNDPWEVDDSYSLT